LQTNLRLLKLSPRGKCRLKNRNDSAIWASFDVDIVGVFCFGHADFVQASEDDIRAGFDATKNRIEFTFSKFKNIQDFTAVSECASKNFALDL
jgi:hypothetical protein